MGGNTRETLSCSRQAHGTCSFSPDMGSSELAIAQLIWLESASRRRVLFLWAQVRIRRGKASNSAL